MDTETETMYAIKSMNKKQLKKKRAGGSKNAYECVLEELKIL